MANKIETFEQFLVNPQVQVDYSYLVIALIVAALLSFILGKLYIRYGLSISNRRKFASNFVLLTTTTTLIIMIVKSSLALSLGLVGALSIVRFRAAIKEPEELSFLFLTIAIGLGLGAGQLFTTIIAFIIISLFIFSRHITHIKEEKQNLYLTIAGKDVKLKDIVNLLKKNCSSVNLKRFDQLRGGNLEVSFLVGFDSFDKFEKAKNELSSLSKSITLTYLDKSGLD
jgi:uncharacterized protein YxeA